MADPKDQEFSHRSEQCLSRIQVALDAFDPDELEADFAGGVIRITFADRRNCILNRQAAAHQIWLAEGASAWHFTYDEAESAWVDTKGKGELLAILGEIISRRLGRPITV
jgi:CyaY protein